MPRVSAFVDEAVVITIAHKSNLCCIEAISAGVPSIITARLVANIGDESGAPAFLTWKRSSAMQKRRHFKQITTLHERLEKFAIDCREAASKMPAGLNRDAMLRRGPPTVRFYVGALRPGDDNQSSRCAAVSAYVTHQGPLRGPLSFEERLQRPIVLAVWLRILRF